MATGTKISALPVATDFTATDTIPIVTGGVTKSITHDVLMEDPQICQAWVNFDGTGTPAISDSFNVSSITDNGTGEYTINFTNALDDANYCVLGLTNTERRQITFVAQLTTSVEIRRNRTDITSTNEDGSYIFVAIFGGK